MIHLNQAGTSWPKPEAVLRAADAALRRAPRAPDATFEDARRRIASAFGISDSERMLLTPGCTSALAVAVSDHAWTPGDRVLTSSMEHHALARPLLALAERGVGVERVPRAGLGPEEGPLDLAVLERELGRGRVKLVAMTAASNVTGELLPLREIVARAHAHGALCLLDGAQVAGWLSMDLGALGVDLFTFAGHKALHAPWGVGGLYVAPAVVMQSPYAACDVPAEGAAPACSAMPGYCDVGSVDRAALAGLDAALAWLDEPAQADRLVRVRAQVERISCALEARGGVTLHGVRDPERRLPTVAFTVAGRTPAEVASGFHAAGIVVAGGLQCAPQAHEALGTAPFGVVRISAGPFTTDDDIARVLAHLRDAL